METEKEQAVPGFSKEYLEKQSRIISELHNINNAEFTKTLPLGENTRAAIFFKAKVDDVLRALYTIHELLYGEVDIKTGGEFVDAAQPLMDYADKYIIESISDNIRFRNPTEI